MAGPCFRIRVFSDSFIRAHEQSLRSTSVVAAPRSQVRLSQKMYLNTCGAILNPFYLQMIVLMRKLCPIPPYQSRQKQGNMKEKSLSHQLCSEKRNTSRSIRQTAHRCMYAILLNKKNLESSLRLTQEAAGVIWRLFTSSLLPRKPEGSQPKLRKKHQAPNPRRVDLFANKATT